MTRLVFRGDGQDLQDHTLSIKQRIGYVPEIGGLYESLT